MTGAGISGAALELDALHASVGNPALDSMRLLSETSFRYPDAISFASGRPYEGLFRIDSLHRYLDRYVADLRAKGVSEDRITKAVFQYGPTHGLLRDAVARMLANDEDIRVAPQSVLITHGAQEAMLIALRGLFAAPDDVLLTVSPCYVGISGAATLLGITLEPVAEREGGLRPSDVAGVARRVRASGRRPVACYVTADFANPSGYSMSLSARRDLLKVAAEEDLLLLEDNPYGLFGRAGEELPTMKSLDTGCRVIYLGTFAKSAFPGARVGYLVADQPVADGSGEVRPLAEELAKVKSMVTVHTAGLSQAVIGGLLAEHDYSLRRANRETADLYVRHLELTLSCLEEHFPRNRADDHGVRWNKPGGGFFLLVEVPFRVDIGELERCARDYGVAWAPMSMFYVGGGGHNVLRLGFSSLTAEEIVEGVRRLAVYITETLAAPQAETSSTVSPLHR